jgi:diphthine-ammonia ligase
MRFIPSIETESVVLSDDRFATVAYLRIKKAILEEKEAPTEINVAIPPLLSPTYAKLAEDVERICERSDSGATEKPLPSFFALQPNGITTHRTGKWVAFGNLTAAESLGAQAVLEDEVLSCFRALHGVFDFFLRFKYKYRSNHI